MVLVKKLLETVYKKITRKKLLMYLLYMNQCNTDKQGLEKKIEDIDKKIPYVSGLVTTTALDTNLAEVEKKMSGAKKYFFEKIENLQTLDLIYFHGMTFFDDDG